MKSHAGFQLAYLDLTFAYRYSKFLQNVLAFLYYNHN